MTRMATLKLNKIPNCYCSQQPSPMEGMCGTSNRLQHKVAVLDEYRLLGFKKTGVMLC